MLGVFIVKSLPYTPISDLFDGSENLINDLDSSTNYVSEDNECFIGYDF